MDKEKWERRKTRGNKSTRDATYVQNQEESHTNFIKCKIKLEVITNQSCLEEHVRLLPR